MKKLIIVVISVLLFAVIGFSIEWNANDYGVGIEGIDAEGGYGVEGSSELANTKY